LGAASEANRGSGAHPLFLASPRAAAITGTEYVIDGGNRFRQSRRVSESVREEAVNVRLCRVGPGNFTPKPLTGRVEDWRAGLGRSLYSLFSRPFRLRVSHYLDRATFPAPATSNAACGFSRTALLLFASPRGLWDLSCWGRTFGISQRTL